MNPTGTIRFVLIAVGVAAGLHVILAAMGVSDAVLQRDTIVLGFIGVATALIVEALLKRKRDAKPQSRRENGR